MLGTAATALRLRIQKSRRLTALYARRKVYPTDPTGTLVRRNDIPALLPLDPRFLEAPDDRPLGEAMMKQNRALMRDGLRKAGISERTLDQLATLETMAPNAGEFLVASVDLTHRMMVLQAVRLFEEADRIKKDYLDDMMLDHHLRIQWMSAYTEIAKQLRDAFDATLTGTQAMARMLGTEKEKAGKPKPGFKPLKRVG